MTKLTATYGKYNGAWGRWTKRRGKWRKIGLDPYTQEDMVPDPILDTMRTVAAPHVGPAFARHLDLRRAGVLEPRLNTHRIKIKHPTFSWDETTALVVDAFNAYDPALGARVRAVCADTSRFTLTDVDAGQAGGRCCPNGYNGYTRAHIEWESDKTINDPVYLAHELGHLIAFDMAEENGRVKEKSYIPRHAGEAPAFYTQSLMYDYLMNKQGDVTLRHAAHQHFIAEMGRNLYEQQVGFANPVTRKVTQDEFARDMRGTLGDEWRLYKNARNMARNTNHVHRHMTASTIAAGLYSSGLGKDPAVFDAMFKQGRDTNILDIFRAARIATREQLADFMEMAVASVIKPLDDFCLAHAPEGQALGCV